MLYGHGDDTYRYDRIEVNFSSNVRYDLNLTGLKRHLAHALDRVGDYPEPDAGSLATALEERYGSSQGTVCVTNGATEAFYLTAAAFRGAVSLIPVPSFSEYYDACRLNGHTLRLTDREPQLLTESDLAGVGLVWLCSPNNPDGRVFPFESLLRLLLAHPRTVFVLDQCYEDFTRERVLTAREAERLGNVALVRSMTKQYGLAGLRLGCLAAAPSLCRKIAAGRMPWSVNRLALEAGRYVLSHPEEFASGPEALLENARLLREGLAAVDGITVRPSDCHFQLAVLREGTAAGLKEYLAEEHGLLIRDASNFRGLDRRHFRIAARSQKENERLIQAIRQWTRHSIR